MSMMQEARILVPETPVLVDERFTISIANLQPFQRCTIRAELRSERDDIFESYAHFIADCSGDANLDKTPSFGGSYSGVDGMGLFWSMVPAPGQRKGLRYTAMNIETPMKFNLQLFDGHILSRQGTDNNLLASKTVLRTYLSPLVERTEVHVGRLWGTLFMPKGKGKFPGVIDMFGNHGHLLEYRAALLASHGFAVFSLAYYCYKDLPTVIEEIELEYFLEAVDWFSKQEQVNSNRIGCVGVSLGAQIALQVAAQSSAVKAVVAISSPTHIVTPIKFKNKFLGSAPEAKNEDVKVHDGCKSAKNVYNHHQKEASKHETVTHIMVLTGEDDITLECLEFGLEMKDRVLLNYSQDVVHISYPKTGHLIEPPYMPMCSISFQKALDSFWVWGGEVIHHSAAQKHAWRNLVSFLKIHLTELPQSRL